MKYKCIISGEKISEEQLKERYRIVPIYEQAVSYSNASNESIRVTTENNGGKTSYYDLPLPSIYRIGDIIRQHIADPTVPMAETVGLIFNEFPSTLNDLIEYKDMYPFQHEIFKACYALQERSDKDIKGGSILRELNKMKYYIDRGLSLAKEGKI